MNTQKIPKAARHFDTEIKKKLKKLSSGKSKPKRDFFQKFLKNKYGYDRPIHVFQVRK